MADKQSAPVAPSHVLLAADSSSHARLGNTVVTATDLSDLIRRLKSNPDVLGIARYGTRAPDDMTPGGDFDLFVILRERPADVESVHFHCGGIPVDMNVRTLADLRADAPLTEIDIAIATSELLYDPTGDVAALSTAVAERWQAATPRLTEHEINWSRFCQRHALDKVRHRLDSEPLLADLLLSTNVYWLLQTYFRVRSVPYPGEKPALAHIQDAEPAMCTLMEAFYASSDRVGKLRISEELTEIVLSPIGGPWRDGETIMFGTHTDANNLKDEGEALLRGLLA